LSTVSKKLRDVQLHYCEPFGEHDEAHDRIIVKRLQKIAVCGAPLLSTVSRKWRDVQLHDCEPFGENGEAHDRIIVNRLQEIAASGQPSRIPRCEAFIRNASCLGTQDAKRSAEMHRA